MKSILVIIFTSFISPLYSQGLSISTGLEKTVVGTELHFSSGYFTKNNWALGAFHQSKMTSITFESDNRKRETSWYGLYINAPLANTKKINVLLQLKTGISENKFIVVVPSIETNINVTKLISVSLGSSFRYSYPAFSLKTTFRPFNSHKQ